MFKIIACEDHPMVADGIKSLLAQTTEFSYAGHAVSSQEVYRLIELQHPSLLLLDLNLKKDDGFTILEQVKKRWPHVSVLIYTMYDDSSLIEKARKLGANGYLTKDLTNTDLLAALREAMAGKAFVEYVTKRKNNSHHFPDSFVEKMRLTKREIEMISLIVQGKHAPQIAEQLSLSEHTVNTHRKNILKKLNLNSVAELVRYAFENGIC